MKTIKDLWNKFKKITQSEIFIWSFPMLAFVLFLIFPYRALGFLFTAIWVLALIFNTDED